MITLSDIKICSQLVRRDLLIMRSHIRGFFIEGAITIACFYLMYGYFLPFTGFSTALIPAIFIGMIVVNVITMLFALTQAIAIDIAYERLIHFYLLLPCSSQLLPIRCVISTIISLMLSSIPLIIGGAFVFSPLISFAHASLSQFILIYTLLLTALSLIVISVAFRVSFEWFRDYIWIFCLTPLLFFGCELVPWNGVVKIAPWLGYLFLLNPVTHGIEGMRRAITASPQYLPVELCAIVLLTWIVIGSVLVHRAFASRFDSV